MRVNEEKLSKATDEEIIANIYLIENELKDEYIPCSAYRCFVLSECKERLKEELKRRGRDI